MNEGNGKASSVLPFAKIIAAIKINTHTQSWKKEKNELFYMRL